MAARKLIAVYARPNIDKLIGPGVPAQGHGVRGEPRVSCRIRTLERLLTLTPLAVLESRNLPKTYRSGSAKI